MKLNLRSFTILYFIIGFLEIFADLAGNQTLVYILKPMIMMSLVIFYYAQVKNRLFWQDKLMIVAFLFSLCGDVFLLLPERYFVFGLGSFLLTHLCYIVIFSTHLKINVWARLAFLIYAFTLIVFLKSHVPKALFLPILVYAFTIATMGIRASERISNALSYRWVLLGAILFILSDSMIAIDKFATKIPLAPLWVMGTYIVAQYLIGVGFLKRSEA